MVLIIVKPSSQSRFIDGYLFDRESKRYSLVISRVILESEDTVFRNVVKAYENGILSVLTYHGKKPNTGNNYVPSRDLINSCLKDQPTVVPRYLDFSGFSAILEDRKKAELGLPEIEDLKKRFEKSGNVPAYLTRMLERKTRQLNGDSNDRAKKRKKRF